jgi:hypothetical protein
MRVSKSLSLFAFAVALSATAQAQFSVSSAAGDAIPAAGFDGDGVWPTGLPTQPGVATVEVPEAVSGIDRVVIEGFQHSWAGDVQATLENPAGEQFNLFLRPGYQNPAGSTFGTPGDFLAGNYTIVESGGASLPTVADGVNIAPGTYNQTFSTGGVTWNSGDAGVLNVPLGQIAGAAGTWSLKIYDWGFGDSGSFVGFTLEGNGSGPSENSGIAYCFGDGTGATCPCGQNGGAGEGCATTSGSGARLSGSGDAAVGADTLVLSVSGGPANKPGIFFQGNNQLAGNPAGDGLLCTTGGTIRYSVNALDATGSTSQGGFAVNAAAGAVRNYQYWFRDTANACGGGFNFTNGWTVTWQ